VKITLSSAESAQSLEDSLVEAGCLVCRLDRTTWRVTFLDERDPDEALLELRFFVAAWSAARPGRSATVSA
jgi:hypothetical protein